MNAVSLNLSNVLQMTDEKFAELVDANRDLRLELTAKGELIIMPPTGGETGDRNFEIDGQLWLWNRQTRLGKAFDSSTGFRLPNGATRSPDVAWIRIEKWSALTAQQRKKFLPICPDFVVELVSESDDLAEVRLKMQEYLENGLLLGWLIIPKMRMVEVFRVNREVERLEGVLSLSGEDVLPGFVLNLQPIWDN
ncbi:Uma2 family endonuclease [Aerosakkonemataceae cyanobacterium BLCC-F50]|uniref:Uma2 family endonuclease n=1 Tax=Floridaenema flaviceps BLCC-F50 TaxID=3153642 RepID=A0ABV4Y0X8_9CYAN